MDRIEYVCQELLRQAVFISYRNSLGHKRIPSGGLYDGHVVVLLVFSDLTAYLQS